MARREGGSSIGSADWSNPEPHCISALKFYLHISPEEQLARFKQRLDDPARRSRMSEADYS